MPVARAGEEWRGAVGAAGFLTLLPLGRRWAASRADVARGSWVFPLVGAALGAAVAGVALAADLVLPPLGAAALAVAFGLIATGALHLDGLADSADGLGGRTRQRALEIMRDHAVGAYGAAAITLDLILRVVLLGALLEHGEALAALVVAGAVSRAAVLPLPLALPYARAVAGPGAVLSEQLSGGRAALGIATAAALSLVVLGLKALPVLALTVLVVLVIGLVARRRLGGVTGDVLGATVELVELTALAGLVVVN
jgi:adenosylcobinamide-GDP ribazoletransferase